MLALVTVMAGSVFFAGCDLSAPTGPPGPTGMLTGTLQEVGGPAGIGPQAVGGVVTLHGPGGHIAAVTVGANGRFSAPATVGTYTVTARSPQYEGGTADCHASGPITVTKGATTKVDVDCRVK